ncbi:MAG: acyl carrier protein phosphodiesterase [Kiritimatiellia bacterium]
MNYLAHIYLAEPELESRLGNFVADFLRGVDRDQFSPRVMDGIRMHWKVDQFTDAHPVFKQSRARLPVDHRRYAGILIDIFYDHFLARHWDQFGLGPLDVYADEVLDRFIAYEGFLPERARWVIQRLKLDRRFTSYATINGIDEVLCGVSLRLSKINPLCGAVSGLEDAYDGLEADFFAFFPELVGYAETLKRASDDAAVHSTF